MPIYGVFRKYFLFIAKYRKHISHRLFNNEYLLFFCQTIKCKKIAETLNKKAFIEKAISPQIIKRQRKLGINIEAEYDLLPGYIFIYTNDDIYTEIPKLL